MYAREGMRVGRSTLYGWMEALRVLLSPLIAAAVLPTEERALPVRGRDRPLGADTGHGTRIKYSPELARKAICWTVMPMMTRLSQRCVMQRSRSLGGSASMS